MSEAAVRLPLSEDAEYYRLVFETIPHMVWATDAEGGLEYCNTGYLEYFGMTYAELATGGWQDAIHPDDLALCLERWTLSLRTGRQFDVEYRLRRHDGEFLWHHGRALPVREVRGGTIQRWFGTCTDIEDKVRAGRRLEVAVRERTAALIESETRFRRLLALSSDWYWEQDREFRFTALNHASPQARALIPSRLGLKRWELGFINMTDADWEAHRRTLEAHQPFRDLVLCRFDEHGEKHWVSTSGEPVFDARGEFTGYRGIGRDVTLQRRAEEALRKSEQRFQAFMDHSPAIAWIKDSHLLYTYVSEPFLRMLNRRREELLGQSDLECWPKAPETGRRAWLNDQLVQRQGAPLQSIESGPIAPSGEVHHWLVNRFPLVDEHGKVGVAGTAIDITERVEAENAARQYSEEVRALLDRLVTAQESERKRVATELHDLIGQNLTALSIWLANLGQALEARADAALGPQLESMQRMVGQTVDAIRGVMAELRPPGLDEYGLLPALRSYAADFQARTSIRAWVECPGALGRLPGPVELSLFRIVQEALTNAAKHSGAATVRVRLEPGETSLRLCVEDDGRGFSDPAGARKSRRGGWGLPAIRERAEACGGSLRIEHPAQGTRLIVEVPVHAH